MRLLRLAQFVRVLFRQPGVRPVRDDADRRVRHLSEKLLGHRVGGDALHAQLGRAQHPRDQRRHDDRDDEPRRDLHAVGPLDDVGDCRVDEHQRDDRRRHPLAMLPARRAPSVTATAADVISTSTPVAYAPPCAVDVRVEDDRDEEGDGGEQRHERPRGARPLRRHAVARQIARHQIEQSGHRRRAGEPQNGDRADVVDRAEQLAEIVVREIRERAARRLRRLRRTPPPESAAS